MRGLQIRLMESLATYYRGVAAVSSVPLLDSCLEDKEEQTSVTVLVK